LATTGPPRKTAGVKPILETERLVFRPCAVDGFAPTGSRRAERAHEKARPGFPRRA